MGKTLPPPAAMDDLTAMLRSRRSQAPTSESAAAPAAVPESLAAPAARPVMDRRSWYMPAEAAGRLAAAVEELSASTGLPKHRALAALVEVALEHVDDALHRLSPRCGCEKCATSLVHP